MRDLKEMTNREKWVSPSLKRAFKNKKKEHFILKVSFESVSKRWGLEIIKSS
jgi:hypothetical protein